MKKVIFGILGFSLFVSLFYLTAQKSWAIIQFCELRPDNPTCEGVAGQNLTITIPNFNNQDRSKWYYVRLSGNDTDRNWVSGCTQLNNGNFKRTFPYGGNVGTHRLIIKDSGKQAGACSNKSAGSLVSDSYQVKFKPWSGVKAEVLNPGRGAGEVARIKITGLPQSDAGYYVQLNQNPSYALTFTNGGGELEFDDAGRQFKTDVKKNILGIWLSPGWPEWKASSPDGSTILLGYFDFDGNPIGGGTGPGFQPERCLGEGVQTAIGCIPTEPGGFVSFFFKYLLGLAGVAGFFLILVAGFQIMTSSGNPEKLEGAKQLLTAAIIGLLVLVFAMVILQVIGVKILGGLPGFPVIQ